MQQIVHHAALFKAFNIIIITILVKHLVQMVFFFEITKRFILNNLKLFIFLK